MPNTNPIVANNNLVHCDANTLIGRLLPGFYRVQWMPDQCPTGTCPTQTVCRSILTFDTTRVHSQSSAKQKPTSDAPRDEVAVDDRHNRSMRILLKLNSNDNREFFNENSCHIITIGIDLKARRASTESSRLKTMSVRNVLVFVSFAVAIAITVVHCRSVVRSLVRSANRSHFDLFYF